MGMEIKKDKKIQKDSCGLPGWSATSIRDFGKYYLSTSREKKTMGALVGQATTITEQGYTPVTSFQGC